MTRTIHIVTTLADDYVASLESTFLDEWAFDPRLLVGRENANIIKPDGTLLLAYRKEVIPPEVCNLAYPALLRAATGDPSHRTTAAGGQPAPEGARNGIIGYLDPDRNSAHCRLTAYTRDDLDGWLGVLPFCEAVATAYRRACPEQYRAAARAARPIPDWLIPRTPWTTLTVNRNWPTAVHRDGGNLGFSALSVLRTQGVEGCYLVFPKYRVAANLGTGDVLCADGSAEFHGTTAFTRLDEGSVRLSTVLYFRSEMRDCLPRR